MGLVDRVLGPVRRMELYWGGACGSKAQEVRHSRHVVSVQEGGLFCSLLGPAFIAFLLYYQLFRNHPAILLASSKRNSLRRDATKRGVCISLFCSEFSDLRRWVEEYDGGGVRRLGGSARPSLLGLARALYFVSSSSLSPPH